MNFEYSEDQQNIQQMAKDFAEKEIMPNVKNGMKTNFSQLNYFLKLEN